MNRDKKVGLALAILLCSIVGAFFFREDSPRGAGPELKDPQKLDEAIAQRDRPPYSEADAATKPRAGSSRRTEDRAKGNSGDLPPWEVPQFLRPDSDTDTTQRGRVVGSRDPFDQSAENSNGPTTLSPPSDDNSPAVPIPLHNSEWDIASNDRTVDHKGHAGSSAAPKLRTHVVAVGDTLSSIAGKYLGTQARYLDIFQANKDQLKSPDDLKVGMKLNIPERNAEAKSSGSSRTTKVEPATTGSASKSTRPQVTSPTSKVTDKSNDASDSNSGIPAKKPKFKPSKTGPAIRRSAEADEPQAPLKSLTQIPPQDLLEIDEGILAELERDTEAVAIAQAPAKSTTVPRVAQAERDTGRPSETDSETATGDSDAAVTTPD